MDDESHRVLLTATMFGQVPGTNVNMVLGTTFPDGDPFAQRQNEPSMAVSSRNPQHLLAGSNDYRTVSIAFTGSTGELGDAWLSVYTTIDGGDTWRSTLLPDFRKTARPWAKLRHCTTSPPRPTPRCGPDARAVLLQRPGV